MTRLGYVPGSRPNAAGVNTIAPNPAAKPALLRLPPEGGVFSILIPNFKRRSFDYFLY